MGRRVGKVREEGCPHRRVCEVLDDGVGVLVYERHGEPVEGLGYIPQAGYMVLQVGCMALQAGYMVLQVGCMALQARGRRCGGISPAR